MFSYITKEEVTLRHLLIIRFYSKSIIDLLNIYLKIAFYFIPVLEFDAESIFVTYRGETRNREPNGIGRMLYRNGDKYEGEWVNGKRHGIGNITFAEDNEKNRVSYSGGWENDQFSGQGLMIWKNGDKYEGQFENNSKNGFGLLSLSNGGTYVGHFGNNSYHGFGKLISAGGDTYEGDWKDGIFSGNGTYTWKNGNKYIGEWKMGYRHGTGILYLPNGEILEQGQWKEDTLMVD
jgi:hypothetical protein